MPLDFSLARNAVNPLETLQVLGMAQQQARVEQERQREQQMHEKLTAAYDVNTGSINPQLARAAYVGAGDVQGAMKFDQGQVTARQARMKSEAEQRKIALRLLDDATDEASYQRSRALAAQYGFDVSTVPPNFDPAFVQAARAELAAIDPSNEGPDWRVIPEGGYLENVRGRGGNAPTIAPPKAGQIEDGYRFRGGDPADKANWEPVSEGGAGSSGPRTFP